MAFPEIGLRAVLEITGFRKNFTQYQTMMRDMDKTTKQTAQSISQSGQKVARSATDLSDASAGFQWLQQAGQVDRYIDAVAELNKEWQTLSKNARVNVDMFDRLTGAGVGMGDALRVAAGEIEFSEKSFDKLIEKGVGVEEAFQRASAGAKGLGQSVNILGRSFSIAAVQTGALVAGIRALSTLVSKSIEDYSELAEATRRLRSQTGLLTQEASGWILAMNQAGVSSATSERAMTGFLSKVADLRREQVLGEESTSDFSAAMNTLGISITNNQGNLKTTEQLIGDVNRAFQGLGPGIVSAQLATDLFGYSGRFLLPVLTDQERSLADLNQRAQDLGATLTALDKQEYEDFRKANNDVDLAIQGVKNQIAREWIPVLTTLKKGLVDVIAVVQRVDSFLRASQATTDAVISGQIALADANTFLVEQYRRGLGIESELARAEEQAAQDRANAAQDLAASIADSEAKIRAEREKTLQQLDKLKADLSQKLLDIDKDAARRWEDIFVTRMRDSLDRARAVAWRLDDLRAELNKRMDAIDTDFAKRWDDILVKRQRDASERALREGWQLADMARDVEQRRLDVIRDYAEREQEQRRDIQKKIRDLEEDARERREKLERDHQERLTKIQLDYQDTVQEAARQNDAVAVARAMRERARELRDEQRRYDNDRQELEDSLKKKRDDINEDRRERENDQERELARALARIDENYKRQLASLEEQKQRERQLREIAYGYELADFNAAKAEQQQAAKDWYDEQIAEMQLAHDRENILREIQYAREKEDFDRSRRRQVDDARYWYAQERDELAEHIDLTGAQLEDAYRDWAEAAADAAGKAAKEIASSVATEISRYQQYQRESPEIDRYQQYDDRRGTSLTTRRTPPPIIVAERDPMGEWRVPGYPSISMAEGGVIQASSPTTVVMGDAGPETGVFLPGGGQSSMNVNHNFGRLGVDFGGLPGGMNTQQAQALVYSVITQLAKGIHVPRT